MIMYLFQYVSLSLTVLHGEYNQPEAQLTLLSPVPHHWITHKRPRLCLPPHARARAVDDPSPYTN